MKIPTLFGLTLLLTALLLSIMYYIYYLERQNKNQQDFTPQNIRYSNITDNSYTITWTSSKPVVSSLTWGPSPRLGDPQNDDRDLTDRTPRFTHIVTLNNLNENSIYYIKIRNGPFFYPEQPLIIKTTPKMSPSLQPALTGRVLDQNLQPLEDSLVFLEIPGASLSSGFVSTGGNFLIPLSSVKSDDLTKNFALNPNTAAILLIQQDQNQSRARLTLPLAKPLPPILFGQDVDLSR